MSLLDSPKTDTLPKLLERNAAESPSAAGIREKTRGVWQTLTSRITAYDRPIFFRDSMVRGPFARLEHEHHFTRTAAGDTLMDDVFEFAAPGGPLGLLIERLVLLEYLRRFLTARNHAIKAAAESEAWKRFVP